VGGVHGEISAAASAIADALRTARRRGLHPEGMGPAFGSHDDHRPTW